MCTDCEARRKLARDALFKAKLGEAASHALKGFAEAAGWKEKTGGVERRRAAEISPVKRSVPKKNSDTQRST